MALSKESKFPKAIRDLVLSLHDIEAFKFGEFKLKSGISSPIYVDLRVVVSYPKILQAVAEAMGSLVRDVKFEVVCGVPYTALPIATVLCQQSGKPMVMRRKEIKDYGLKKIIEGVFSAGQRCLVIEDLVTSGVSVFETVQPLRQEGLQVTDVVVLVDREQGGRANLQDGQLQLHSVVAISDMLTILEEAGRVQPDMATRVRAFIRDNQVRDANMAKQFAVRPPTTAPAAEETKAVKPKSEEKINTSSSSTNSGSVKLGSYSDRAKLSGISAVSRELLTLMERKKTNLCVSADVTTGAALLRLADLVGPHICVLKTHIDIIEDFDDKLIPALVALAVKHGFLLFEDRKFADIGNTVLLQYTKGIYRIADWAHIVNAHTVPGPGVIAGLKQPGLSKGRGLLLLAEMSSEGSLATGSYTAATVDMAAKHKDFVMGFVSQRRVSADPAAVVMTPGVSLETAGDKLGQQYNTPQRVVRDLQCDVIIVGRAIIEAQDPVAACKTYQQAGWKAYEERLAL